MSKTVQVLESLVSVSGLMMILIESDFGRPDNKTILRDEFGKEWSVTDNTLFLDAKIVAKLPNRDSTYFCRIEAVGHEKSPEVQLLEIITK